MGRHKKADREVLLTAARQAIVDRGAAHLTLDAVAEYANISKASVIYEFKSKDGLVKAFVADRLRQALTQIDEARSKLEDPAGSGLRARLGITSACRATVDDRSVALTLIAAMAADAELRTVGQQYFRISVDDVRSTASSPRAAMLAFLALEGLHMLEYLDFHQLSDDEFHTILKDIEWLSGLNREEGTN